MARKRVWRAHYDGVANYSYTSRNINLRVSLEEQPNRDVWLHLTKEEAIQLQADLARVFRTQDNEYDRFARVRGTLPEPYGAGDICQTCDVPAEECGHGRPESPLVSSE